MTFKPHQYPRATYSVDITEAASLVVMATMARDQEGRASYAWVLRDGSGKAVDHGVSLMSPRSQPINAQRATYTMLSMMSLAGEAYALNMHGHESDSIDLMSPAAMEFCYLHSSEIEMLHLELGQELGELGL